MGKTSWLTGGASVDEVDGDNVDVDGDDYGDDVASDADDDNEQGEEELVDKGSC